MIDVVQDCAKVVSFEVLLGVLKEVSHGGDTILSPFFEQAQKLMTPELPDDAIKRLQDLYRAIRFEQYSLNDRMQKVDERVLEASAASGDKVVDLGAGTGRLAVPMMARGFEVTAVENTPRHVDLLKKTEGLRVVNRDWIQTGLSEESQDVAYCLGRSFLHEFTFERQNAFFEEVARILKPGGTLILDIPDRNRGNYARLVNKFGETMEDRGILYRKGTIYDSPDGKNYFTRYVFSLEDIADLARRHGFELVKTQREPLDTGAGDENIYITLRKVSPLAVEALAAA
jgi:SAM-dependent methyltransferase